MKLQNNRSWFTLIELLVVITIMGILATGAVNVFTTQLQKARDSTRISDIQALKNAVEQFYQDTSNYPAKDSSSFEWDIENYVQTIPSDGRTGINSENSVFDYLYNVSEDRNLIPLQEYELSTHFENQGNLDNRAANDSDSWDDEYRLEVWIDVDDTDWTSSKPTIVDWDISGVSAFGCVTPTWWAWACTNVDDPLLIK